MGCVFVSNVSFTAVLYEILCYLGPYYNGTRLYIPGVTTKLAADGAATQQ